MTDPLSLHDVLHVLRNPKWNTEEQVLRAQLQAADMLERADREIIQHRVRVLTTRPEPLSGDRAVAETFAELSAMNRSEIQLLISKQADKIERMVPVINAAVALVRAGGRHHSELAYNKLASEVTRYKP